MNTPAYQELTIERFESGDIDADTFDHLAHVYVGWLYIRKYELSEAITRFNAALKRLVAKLGAENKYHTTLTWFFLLLIAERATPNESWKDFERCNDDLIGDSKELLSRYYSDGNLFSERARGQFVLPDQFVGS